MYVVPTVYEFETGVRGKAVVEKTCPDEDIRCIPAFPLPIEVGASVGGAVLAGAEAREAASMGGG